MQLYSIQIFFVWRHCSFLPPPEAKFLISVPSVRCQIFSWKCQLLSNKLLCICLTKIVKKKIIWTRQYFLKRHQCVLHRQTKRHHLAIFRGHSSPVHSGRTVTTLILKRDYDLTMPACHYFINPSQCRSLVDQVSKKYLVARITMEILNIIFDTKIREDKTRDQLFCEKS